MQSNRKHDNCQAAVSLSVNTASASLPVAWRLYLPEAWCQDKKRCKKTGIPSEIEFQTKPEIALEPNPASNVTRHSARGCFS
jgi:SRSO17 transposase